jgi:outer membrane protein assembly factor BamD (BamD/ComL family)
MKHKTDKHRILADYLYDNLDPEEREVLEREIQKNPELYESYQLNIQVKDYLQAKIQLEEMKSDPQLENAEKLADLAFDVEGRKEEDHVSIPFAKKKRIRTISFAAAIAATIAIIISVGMIPFSTDQNRLFDRYYEPIEASDFSQRGKTDETYRDIANGINSYADGNYKQSIDQFSALASNPAIRSEVQLFTALSYLGLGDYQQAQKILESVDEGNNRYQPETLWYLSLCYLKSGEYDKATSILGRLENYDGYYKEDARILLKKLRRFKK